MDLRRRLERAAADLDAPWHILDGDALPRTVGNALTAWHILPAAEGSPSDDLSRNHAIVGADVRTIMHTTGVDHLRVVHHAAGTDGAAALAALQVLDSELEAHLHFAVSLRLGYLSPDIDHAGTGLRARALLFLPALHRSGAVVPAHDRPGHPAPSDTAAVRPLAIAGQPVDSLYTLTVNGKRSSSEEEVLSQLAEGIRPLVHYECEARQLLLQRHGEEIQDAAYRGWGTLTQARRLERAEMEDLAAMTGFAASAGVLTGTDPRRVLELLFLSSDAVVSFVTEKTSEAATTGVAANGAATGQLPRDRAAMVRRHLGIQE